MIDKISTNTSTWKLLHIGVLEFLLCNDQGKAAKAGVLHIGRPVPLGGTPHVKRSHGYLIKADAGACIPEGLSGENGSILFALSSA